MAGLFIPDLYACSELAKARPTVKSVDNPQGRHYRAIATTSDYGRFRARSLSRPVAALSWRSMRNARCYWWIQLFSGAAFWMENRRTWPG